MSLIRDMERLVREHSAVQNAAFDLWDWQPDCAVQRKLYGDYHSERQPDADEVIKTASSMLSYLAGYDSKNLTDEEKAWIVERFGQRRGEPHKKFHDWPHDVDREDECS